MIDVEAYRTGFGEEHIAMPQCRNLTQRVDRIHFRRVRHGRHERIRHALFVTGYAGDPDVIALRRANDLKLWHGMLLWNSVQRRDDAAGK